MAQPALFVVSGSPAAQAGPRLVSDAAVEIKADLEHRAIPARAELLAALDAFLRARHSGIAIFYYAGSCLASAAAGPSLAAADTDRRDPAASAVAVSDVIARIARSGSPALLIAEYAAVSVSAKVMAAAWDRAFRKVSPDLLALAAASLPKDGDSAPGPVARALARLLREGAFAAERDPEGALDGIQALFRLWGIRAPLWRRPVTPPAASPPRAAGAPSQQESMRSESPPEPAIPGPAGPLRIEVGGTGNLWFATNRRPIEPSDISKGFSSDEDECLHHGRCEVYVPESHRIGLRSTWWDRVVRRFFEDPIELVSLHALEETRYWAELRNALASLAPTQRDMLVLIHGYHTSFEAAACWAAQISCDLQFPGATAFFSWPSRGALLGFAADAASIESSEGHIADFLTRCAEQSGAARVHVIAHSMGNRGFLRALNSIVDRARLAAGARFGHLILAAPDVDARVFVRLAEACHQVAQRTTLYVSGKDKALAASARIYRRSRVGFAPPITVTPHVDTVHVAGVDLTVLGHGYVAECREVLRDIHELLFRDAHPGNRQFLRQKRAPAGPYWAIS
jgi:esterase/lipase superfamily enzyme